MSRVCVRCPGEKQEDQFYTNDRYCKQCRSSMNREAARKRREAAWSSGGDGRVPRTALRYGVEIDIPRPPEIDVDKILGGTFTTD